MDKLKIKLKKLNKNAKLPIQAREGDFCYDVYATEKEEIMPNVFRYKLGFAYEMVRDKITLEYYNKENCSKGIEIDLRNSPLVLDIDFRPRSSIYKTGLVLCNAIGTLDEFYRNEAMAIFYHIIPELPEYNVGERIGQIKIGITIPCEFEFVDEINENTQRGKGGFGCSGNK